MMQMTSKFGLILAIVGLTVFGTNCAGGQVKDEATEQTGYSMEQARSFLADLTYAPYGKGFEYKVTAVPQEDFQSWLSRYKPQIMEALNAIDTGFVLQVTGHTDSIGPRNAEAKKKGNIYYSTERAKNVHKALQRLGVPMDKMTYRGIADDETLPGTEFKDRRNRRVTFKIVPAE